MRLKHPVGLYVLFISNMGERFGFYTMFAILTLYLQDYFGWDEAQASVIYGWFIMGSYVTPLLGGILADKFWGYTRTVLLGLIIMTLGYLALYKPWSHGTLPVYAGLAFVAIGVGLFKGNMNVLVGNLYSTKEYSHLRDSAFVIYYMGINIGAFFAPHIASFLKTYFLSANGFIFDPTIAAVANKFLSGITLSSNQIQHLTNMAQQIPLETYCQQYIHLLNKGYHAAFGIAAIAMIFSALIFVIFKKYYQNPSHLINIQSEQEEKLSKHEIKERLLAAAMVFLVVIFFWIAFHQNGSTLTFFARSYTNLHASKFTSVFFSIPQILLIFFTVFMISKAIGKSLKMMHRYIVLLLASISGVAFLLLFNNTPNIQFIDPSLFQALNPLFIVLFSPLVIYIFKYLASKNAEPSTPLKIGIGMIITSIAYLIMVFPSVGLPRPIELEGSAVDSSLAVSPYWLISSYLIITIAELFLSPMGISFVSKIAPNQYKGLMQAGWYLATAIGNLFAGFIGILYYKWHLTTFFTLLVILCLASAFIMFFMVKHFKILSKY